jgi:hypothetical protein
VITSSLLFVDPRRCPYESRRGVPFGFHAPSGAGVMMLEMEPEEGSGY